MQWENLTAPDFAKAVKKVKGVCVIVLGVIEKHGEHLPLGTDLFQGMHVALEATKREEAIVFPPYYFTQIHEAKHQLGAIAIPGEIMWKLLLACCEEISRNGLKKIILLNAHGGNSYFAPFFCQMALEKERDYTLYYPLGDEHGGGNDKAMEEKIRKLSKAKYDGHAGESETSNMLVIRPDLVRIKNDIPSRGVPNKRPPLPHVYSGIWWYQECPHHYRGQAKQGKVELGKLYLEGWTRYMVKVIKAVKNDTVYSGLTKEFYGRMKH